MGIVATAAGGQCTVATCVADIDFGFVGMTDDTAHKPIIRHDSGRHPHPLEVHLRSAFGQSDQTGRMHTALDAAGDMQIAEGGITHFHKRCYEAL